MNLLQASLLGGAAFRDIAELLQGLEFAQAVEHLPGAPYSVAELLAHLHATMRVSLDLVYGRLQGWPEDLETWPAAPADPAAFQVLLTELRLMLAEANMLAQDPSSQAQDILLDLAIHNAYHWGQVALLRQQQGTVFADQSVET